MTYDADNRLKTVDGNNVVMDDDGNLNSGPLTNDTFATYVYDARNRLINAGSVTNVYDSSGNRIALNYGTNRTLFVVNPNAALPEVLMRIKNGVTNYYIYEMPWTALPNHRDGNRNQHADLPLRLSRQHDCTVGGQQSGDRPDQNTRHYGLDDVILPSRYEIDINHFWFQWPIWRDVRPKRSDVPLANARCTIIIRFCAGLSPADPSGFNGGLNWYAYANGNPVGFVDPVWAGGS